MNRSFINKRTLLKESAIDMMKKNIVKLGSKNGRQRQKARSAMVAIGEPAIDIFAELAMHPDWIVRREAVKALSQMKNNIAAPILVNALEDEYNGVRSIASEGLISLGKQGLIPLLEVLSSCKLTFIMRQVAHHVVKEISVQYSIAGTAELLKSLENDGNYYLIPTSAGRVLNRLIKNDYPASRDSFH